MLRSKVAEIGMKNICYIGQDFLKLNSSITNLKLQDTCLDEKLVYEKEFISLYISGISENVRSTSQFLFLIFYAQCIIYDTFSFLTLENFGG